MGFTTGFIGGLTLTYSILYLSLHLHRTNRTQQALLLNQQSRLLINTVDPPSLEYDLPSYRVEQAGISEQLKDRWNREIETLVSKIQTTNWEEVRIRWENRIGNIWGRVRDTDSAKELEQRLKENLGSAGKEAKESAKNAAESVKGKRLLEES